MIWDFQTSLVEYVKFWSWSRNIFWATHYSKMCFSSMCRPWQIEIKECLEFISFQSTQDGNNKQLIPHKKILDFVEKQSSPLDPQVALALARAAYNTLYTESDLIWSHNEECWLMLDILDCCAEELDFHLSDANHQIAVILNTFQWRGLPFEVSSTLLEHIFSTSLPLVFGNTSLPDEGSNLDYNLNSTYCEWKWFWSTMS